MPEPRRPYVVEIIERPRSADMGPRRSKETSFERGIRAARQRRRDWKKQDDARRAPR